MAKETRKTAAKAPEPVTAAESATTQNGAGKRNRYLARSAYGTVKPGSFNDEGEKVSLTIVSGPVETLVVGYNKHADLVRGMKDKTGDVLARGALNGGRGKTHIAVNFDEPLKVRGRVSNIHRSGPGKQPSVNCWVMREVDTKDGPRKFGSPIRAFGDAAGELDDLQDGDILVTDAREVRVKRTGKDGAVYYQDGLEMLGAPTFSTPEADTDDDA